MLEQYNQIDTITEKEEIPKLAKIQKQLAEKIGIEHVNKRLTMNLFKSILSSNYFGQPSFLNVIKTSLSYEEQEQLMYKDYVSNIVEIRWLHDIKDGKLTIEQIANYLENNKENTLLSNEIKKIYQEIQTKYIEKNRSIQEIQQYLQNITWE